MNVFTDQCSFTNSPTELAVPSGAVSGSQLHANLQRLLDLSQDILLLEALKGINCEENHLFCDWEQLFGCLKCRPTRSSGSSPGPLLRVFSLCLCLHFLSHHC